MDLADDPGLEYLPELLEASLVSQVEAGGIGGPALEVQTQRLVQHLAVLLGEALKVPGAAAVTEDAVHGHQQEPLQATHHAEVTHIRNGLEESDQTSAGPEINGGNLLHARRQIIAAF